MGLCKTLALYNPLTPPDAEPARAARAESVPLLGDTVR